MEQKTSPAKSSFQFGVLFGAIMILQLVISYVLNIGTENKTYSIIVNTLNFLILPFTFIYLACNNYKNNLNKGFISLGECIKIGITKGKTWKDAIVRSQGFGPYEIRIQTTITGTIEEVYNLEQTLHAEFRDFKHTPKYKFGGHTECFSMGCLPRVLDFLRCK